jgi:hypothetical protein
MNICQYLKYTIIYQALKWNEKMSQSFKLINLELKTADSFKPVKVWKLNIVKSWDKALNKNCYIIIKTANDHEIEFHEIEIAVFQEIEITIPANSVSGKQNDFLFSCILKLVILRHSWNGAHTHDRVTFGRVQLFEWF